MTQTGEPFGESPEACPFLALELDRDRRSDRPDYRHRCYAEPTPQPRAIAHQEAYCLSADFPSCPIFQGWALRAAARPAPVEAGDEGRGASSTSVSGQPPLETPLPPPLQPPLPADVAPVVPAPGEAWPSEAFTPPEPVDAPRQIGAFDAPPSDSAPADGDEPDFVGLPPAPASAPHIEQEAPSTWSSVNPPIDEPEEAPVPGFLAGRREREPLAPRAARPDVQFREKVTREDVVPSWDLTDRYGAQVKQDRGGGGGGDRFGGLVTALAVIVILGLGVAGVIFLPGLLSGRHPATPTPLVTAAPTPLASGTSSLPPGATQTPGSTVGPTVVPSGTSEPAATPRVYRVKAGDTLGRIAHKFHLTVADIMAANPEITNPDHIVPGQIIVIPYPTPTATP